MMDCTSVSPFTVAYSSCQMFSTTPVRRAASAATSKIAAARTAAARVVAKEQVRSAVVERESKKRCGDPITLSRGVDACRPNASSPTLEEIGEIIEVPFRWMLHMTRSILSEHQLRMLIAFIAGRMGFSEVYKRMIGGWMFVVPEICGLINKAARGMLREGRKVQYDGLMWAIRAYELRLFDDVQQSVHDQFGQPITQRDAMLMVAALTDNRPRVRAMLESGVYTQYSIAVVRFAHHLPLTPKTDAMLREYSERRASPGDGTPDTESFWQRMVQAAAMAEQNARMTSLVDVTRDVARRAPLRATVPQVTSQQPEHVPPVIVRFALPDITSLTNSACAEEAREVYSDCYASLASPQEVTDMSSDDLVGSESMADFYDSLLDGTLEVPAVEPHGDSNDADIYDLPDLRVSRAPAESDDEAGSPSDGAWDFEDVALPPLTEDVTYRELCPSVRNSGYFPLDRSTSTLGCNVMNDDWLND